MTEMLNPIPKDISPSEIRFLEPDDARSLMQLRHRAIRECAVYFGTPCSVELKRKVGDYRRQLTRYRDFGNAAYLGYWREGALAGLSGIRVRKLRREKMGLIYSTFVEREFRGQGMGKALVNASRQKIDARWGLQQCFMNVEVHNEPALRLYQRCGFSITGKESAAFFIEGVAHDVYILEWKTLGYSR